MASIAYGGGIVDARGSLAGNTYSRNANGAYTRARVAPTNPNTNPQSAIRNRFSTSAQNWRELTDAQRDAWIAAALTQQGSYVNRLGQQAQYTGQQLFMKVQSLWQAWGYAGGNGAADPPPVPPPLSPAPPSIEFGDATLEVDATPVVTAFTVAVESAAATNQLLVYASPPVSAGVMRPASTTFRLLESLSNVTALAGLDIEASYTGVYGTALNAGDAVFIKLLRLSTTSWRTAAPLIIKAVAVVGA